MAKKYRYHVAYKYQQGDIHVSFMSQLYKIGVYVIMNNDSALQFVSEPSRIVTVENKLKKEFEKGTITNLEFTRSITVTKNSDGFWEEVL